MHGVMLGVMKSLLKLWFASEHKKERFSVYNHVALFDECLAEIKPTIEITKTSSVNPKYPVMTGRPQNIAIFYFFMVFQYSCIFLCCHMVFLNACNIAYQTSALHWLKIWLKDFANNSRKYMVNDTWLPIFISCYIYAIM